MASISVRERYAGAMSRSFYVGDEVTRGGYQGQSMKMVF